MDSQRPPFGDEDATGLAAFWRVYDAHYDELADRAVRRMHEPEFAQLLAHLDPRQLALERRADRERLEQALAGDTQPLVENLRTQAATYARLGIPFRTWQRLLRGVARDLTPLLVAAWSPEPDRLRGALLAMQSYFDWTMAELAEVYLKTAEEARQHSEARFRQLSEASFLGVVEVDLRTMIVREANDAFLELIGRTRAELAAGQLRTTDFTPPEWRKVDEAALEEVASTRQSQPHEKEYLRPDGERVPVMVGGAKLDEHTLIGFALDISQQKQLERFRARTLRLEVENRRIEEASRLKSEFLANMSHELRTPLNAIIGFTELIHSGQVSPEMPQYSEFLGDVLTSGRHLLQLINDVLDLSKVEAGRLEFHAEVVDLRKVVQEVTAILRTTAARKRLEVSAEIDPALSALFIDPSRLEQILYNYISNAMKFTDEGGKVMIRGRPDAPGLFRLEVEDTGIGIASADIPRLFSEFQQLDAGTGKTQQGTGLGLALTKRLAEAQGGSAGVTSTPGMGSTFFALLPRTATVGERTPEPRTESAAPGEVLLVDDDEASTRLMSATLAQLGYRARAVRHGIDGLTLAAQAPPLAVVLDLLMPEMDGFEFLERFRQLPRCKNVPVIVWSMKDLTPADLRRLETSVQGILQKGQDAGSVILQARGDSSAAEPESGGAREAEAAPDPGSQNSSLRSGGCSDPSHKLRPLGPPRARALSGWQAPIIR